MNEFPTAFQLVVVWYLFRRSKVLGSHQHADLRSTWHAFSKLKISHVHKLCTQTL